MTNVDSEALKQTGQMVQHYFGSITDLPEEVQNTIANMYYEFCAHYTEGHPKSFSKAKSFEEGLKQSSQEMARVIAAVRNMPDIIKAMRDSRKTIKSTDYDFLVQFFLASFKYDIPNIENKSQLRLRIEKHFYQKNVREIPDLWRRI